MRPSIYPQNCPLCSPLSPAHTCTLRTALSSQSACSSDARARVQLQAHADLRIEGVRQIWCLPRLVTLLRLGTSLPGRRERVAPLANAKATQRKYNAHGSSALIIESEPNKLSEAYGLSGTQACRAHSSVALWGWHVIARTDIATLHDYQTTLRHHSGRTLTHFHPPLPNGNRQASQSLRNSVGSRFGRSEGV